MSDLEIKLVPTPRRGVARAIAVLEGKTIHLDEIHPTRDADRHRFVKKLVKIAPTLSEARIEAELLAAAVPEDVEGAAGDDRDDRDDRDDESQHAAERLVKLALAEYRLGVTQEGDAFAVANDGPSLALMLRGSRDSLRGHLLRRYRTEYGRPPGATAVSDCLAQLEAEAAILEPEAVHQRVGETEDGRIVIDLGDASGRSVIVGPKGWQVSDKSDLLFKRTRLTSPMPVPQRGASISELREFLNVTDESWPLALGWLVASLIPGIAHPILSLGGEQGVGKSTAAYILVQLFDPSPVPLRTRPRDERQWVISAAGSWGVAVDNISTIPEWWSDALCKASTGAGWIDRKLFSDLDLAIVAFRRVMILTSIDAGALRGDLADRLVILDLDGITPAKRQSEKKLLRRYEAAKPRLLGALLDLLVKVLAELPRLELTEMHRMADYSRVLAALDTVTGLACLPTFLGQRSKIAAQVIAGDSVGSAIRDFMTRQGAWTGTATTLLQLLSQERQPKDWPRTPNALSGRLVRLAPALREIGIGVDRDRAAGGNRDRAIYLTRTEAYAEDRPRRPDRPGSSTDGDPRDDRDDRDDRLREPSSGPEDHGSRVDPPTGSNRRASPTHEVEGREDV